MDVARLEKQLRTAQDAYLKACEGIDNTLRAAVSQDPSRLDDARALQARYALRPQAAKLVAAKQPGDGK